MRNLTIRSVLSIATLTVTLPVAAAGVGGAAGGASQATMNASDRAAMGAAERATMGASERASMNAAERASAGAAERATAGAAERATAGAAEHAGMETAGEASSNANQALENAGASEQAMETVSEHSASDKADAALEASGPAEAAMTAHDDADVGANANASLTGEVQSKLNGDEELKGIHINSDVKSDGSVTLNGTVKNDEQKQHAENLVADIDGVSSVNSNITVEGK